VEEIFTLLSKIIETELKYINKLAIITENIRNSRDFTIYEIFLLIDSNNEKYLNESNLLNFLKKNDHKSTISEVNDIFFRLHKKDNFGISYDDFQDIFTPIKTIEEDYTIQELNQNPNLDAISIYSYDNLKEKNQNIPNNTIKENYQYRTNKEKIEDPEINKEIYLNNHNEKYLNNLKYFL